MTIEKELAITFGYITERFNKLFSLIDRFMILSAAEDLAKCNFLNIRKNHVSGMMKRWTKDVKKVFESNKEKSITANNIKLPDQYETAIKDFSKRLEDFSNADVKAYLENIQIELLKHQGNEIVSQYLNMIKDALIRNQEQVLEIQRLINEKYPNLSSVTEIDKRGE